MREMFFEKSKARLLNNTEALTALKNNPDLFSPEELISLAVNHRSAAIYINAHDSLRNKIDENKWRSIMVQYSWDAAIEYEKRKPLNNNEKLRDALPKAMCYMGYGGLRL